MKLLVIGFVALAAILLGAGLYFSATTVPHLWAGNASSTTTDASMATSTSLLGQLIAPIKGIFGDKGPSSSTVAVLPVTPQQAPSSDPYYYVGTYPNSTGTVTKDLKADYGSVTLENLNKAIDDAKAHFKTSPNDVYVIKIPAGTYNMFGSIMVTNVQPGPYGRLVIIGAGKNDTTIMQDGQTDGIHGVKVYRVSFVGMHFALPYNTTTLGRVVSKEPGILRVEVPVGFPTPLDVFDKGYDLSQACPSADDGAGGWGRYLKVYSDSKTDPVDVDFNQTHLPWCKPVAVPGKPQQWDFILKRENKVPDYAIGNLIAVKSKSVNSAYQFVNGDDFEFRDILWTQRARGTWQGQFNHVKIIGNSILRPAPINGQAFAFATPGGGVQIGDVNIHSYGHIVENNHFEATGDDVIAMFNADTIVRNNYLYSDGRLNIGEGSNVTLENNNIQYTRVVHTTNDKGEDDE